MKTTSKLKEKNVKGRLRLILASGKTITPLQAWKHLGTSRLAVYIRRLRLEGMEIETEIVTENGDTFARYRMVKAKKVSRIKDRAYMRQAYSRN